MKFHLLPLAFCAALAGCATYYEPVPAAPYDPGYVYTYPYPYYPYPYAYPYYYGAYPSFWISGTWFCCSGGGHRHHRHMGSWNNGMHR